MNIFRAIARISAGIAGSCFGYLAYEVEKTKHFFDNLLDKKVLELERKHAEYIYLEDAELQELMKLEMHSQRTLKLSSIDLIIKNKFEQWRMKYLKKLMSIALHKESECRMKAVDILSRCKLTDRQYAQLAQMCDARTAVSLARTKDTDIRYFRTRTTHPHGEFTVKELIIEMRDLLVEINKKKEHQCLTYFLSTTFPGFQNEQGTFFDIELRGRLRTPFQYTEEILFRCLKELVHYCEVGNNAAEIYRTKGLQIAMDVYRSIDNKERDIHMIEFVKFIQNVSLIPNTLHQLFVTGWIKVLAEWLHHDDRTISVKAAHALANLDEDDAFTAYYGKNVLLLHPLHHLFNAKSFVDVIFVHGLLGGALSTWRQRERGSSDLPITLYDLKKTDPAKKKSKFKRSDKTADKYIKTVTKLKRQEWEKIGNDFEFVFSDFPSECETDDEDLTLPGSDKIVDHFLEDEELEYTTSCWPQDWLSKDYPRARILSIDYNSRLSDWQFCCFRYDKNDIQAIAENLLAQLIESGVGDRPIVWVAHSMGGLILKSMLLQAWERNDTGMQNFHKNTKAIIFISTPHFGSHIATMFDTTRSIWMPSEEVNDLRTNSKFLLELHEEFKKWATEFPARVVTFTETRSTQLSGLGLQFEFFIVTPESGSPEIGDIFYLPYDHINICKPSNSHLRLREDIVTDGHKRQEVLSNAKITDEDYFVAPPGNIPADPSQSANFSSDESHKCMEQIDRKHAS
ncbi:protein SERAC1-like isoform X2 [Nilaparvata lugens]|uniref:protein SERAC1-like isoform X2 n=1 Tax=Nilaparvata lugens TaxID=108931 RepID=UPI00193E08E9|nr:protein SERAC1-like isoform X2 [Nilaparvata lugens]